MLHLRKCDRGFRGARECGIQSPVRTEVIPIGNCAVPLVVIDEAAADAELWHARGAELDWAPRGDYYPGPRAIAPLEYLHALQDALRFALGQVFGWRSRVEVLRCFYSLATTPGSELSLAQRVPHVDSYDPRQIAFVHYLCPPRFGGTAFYRQRSTGFERIDERNCAAFEQALEADFARLREPAPAYIGGSDPRFERLHACPAAFNRLIVFPGNLLHCADLAGVELDPDPAKGRLTIAGFLRPQS